jgi:hypothetical protein
MPAKKKRVITVSADEEIKIEAVQPEPERKTPSEKVGDFIASIVNCGHQNMHYTDGDLYCTLEKGHSGDHQALLNDAWTSWSDAAGIPIKKHA